MLVMSGIYFCFLREPLKIEGIENAAKPVLPAKPKNGGRLGGGGEIEGEGEGLPLGDIEGNEPILGDGLILGDMLGDGENEGDRLGENEGLNGDELGEREERDDGLRLGLGEGILKLGGILTEREERLNDLSEGILKRNKLTLLGLALWEGKLKTALTPAKELTLGINEVERAKPTSACKFKPLGIGNACFRV